MNIQLPAHSEPCHSVTVYDGDRYMEEQLLDRRQCGDVLDVSKYEHFKEARFEHSASNLRGDKQAYEYRTVARIDGIWFTYDPLGKCWGLPELAHECAPKGACPQCPPDKITETRPADVEEVSCQEDPQSKPHDADESLTPATPVKEKKSRTRLDKQGE